MKHLVLILTSFLVMWNPPHCLAELDEVQSRLLGFYTMPLRWDNVEGKSEWISGKKPEYNFAWGCHGIDLKPGETTTVRIPPREMLRIADMNGQLQLSDLEVSVSNGSGLYAFFSGQKSLDGRSMLVSPEASVPCIIRIQRPIEHNDPIDVAAFISRIKTLNEIARYRKMISLPEKNIKLSMGYKNESRSFWYICPEKPVAIHITGPMRLKIESRYIYAQPESQRLATYRVIAKIDDDLFKSIEFITRPEEKEVMFADGSYQVLGRLEKGYIEIPGGTHTLTLKPTACVFVRLLLQEEPGYLFSRKGVNAPDPGSWDVRSENYPEALKKSIWELDDFEMRNIAEDRGSSPSVREPIALRIARDNRKQQGGLTGWSLMQESARIRRDYPDIQKTADKIWQNHTLYRDLLPSEKISEHSQKKLSFFIRRLKTPHDNTNTVVSEQHGEDLLKNLPTAYFNKIPPPNTRGGSTTYHLPPRCAHSLLRVIVDASLPCEQEFIVQYDNGTSTRFTVFQSPELSEAEYDFSQGEIGILLNRLKKGYVGGRGINVQKIPSKIISAGTFEIMLPPEVGSVTIKRTDHKPCNLMLALQYRDSKPFSLTEREYLNLLNLQPDHQKLYDYFLDLLSPAEIEEKSCQRDEIIFKREFSNLWTPLVRFINYRAEYFKANISAITDFQKQRTSEHTKPESILLIKDQTRKALGFEEQGQWLTALEMWSQVYNETEGIVREKTRFSQIKMLKNLGEDFLAEHLLRSIFLFSKDPLHREIAFRELETDYREKKNYEALISLYASSLKYGPSRDTMNDLIEALYENSEYQMALMLALICSNPERPADMLMKLTFRMGWGILCDRLLDKATSENQKYFWKGMRACRYGDFEKGIDHLLKGGALCSPLVSTLKKGRDIRLKLFSNDFQTRTNAVIEWEQWQANHPGPFVWEDASAWITDYAGGKLLYSPVLNRHIQMFSGTENRGIKLKVLGPVCLRIDVRPLHPKDTIEPIEGWIEIREGDILHVFPVNRNLPAKNLKLIGCPDREAGQKVSTEYSVGPGLHQIEIRPKDFTMLARIYVKYPELSLGVLPLLSCETLMAAVQEEPQPEVSGISHVVASFFGRPSIVVLPRDAENPVISIPVAKAYGGSSSSVRHDMNTMIKVLSSLASLRPPDIPGPERRDFSFSHSVKVEPLPVAESNKSVDILRRMTLLAWHWEQHPEDYPEAFIEAEALFEQNARKNIPGLKSLYGRITRDMAWSPFTSIQGSAGFRVLDIKGWYPESPSLRIRKALLQPFDPGDYVLYGDRELVLSLRNLKETHLEVVFSMENIDNIPLRPMTVTCSIDEKSVQTFSLTPTSPIHKLHIPVPVGEHYLQIRIDKRFENQFLRLSVSETRSKQDLPSNLKNYLLGQENKRQYHIATHNDPVAFEIEGPAWLRIDKMIDGDTISKYCYIKHGWQNLSVIPSQDKEEVLLRLSKKIKLPSTLNLALIRQTHVDINPLEKPLFHINTIKRTPLVEFGDAFKLGGQEDGTWSFSVHAQRRRNVQEDTEAEDDPEEFFETGIEHRYFHKDWRSLFHSRLFGRIRANGGPTWGIKEHVYHDIGCRNLKALLNGEVFLQRPDSNGSGGTQWTGKLSCSVFQPRAMGTKTYNTPMVSALWRHMSMDKLGNYQAEDVDQDIYTPFKADHHYELRISDTLTHQPWLDTIWDLKGSVASNEDLNIFNPDQISFRAGWKQLFGDFQANLFYRCAHFFEDDDRDESINRYIIGTEFFLNRWFSRLYRIELGLNLFRELKLNETSGMIFCSLHFGNGRAYRDFRPSEIDFPNIQTRRIPHNKINNTLSHVEQ